MNTTISEPKQDEMEAARNSIRRRSVAGKCALVVVAAGLMTSACTGGSADENSQPEVSVDQTEDASGQADELGQEPDLPIKEIGADGDTVTDDELVFADENGLSEEVADAPALTVDDIAEENLELTPEVPQADLAVSESALCATVQIGRDAVADGNEAVSNEQRGFLVERAGRVGDEKLSKTLAGITNEAPLDLDVVEEALARCVELGFER